MKEPNVYEEALASTIEAYRQDGIKKYDTALRKAIKKYLSEHADPKTDYGIQWYPRNEIMKAINRAGVEV